MKAADRTLINEAPTATGIGAKNERKQKREKKKNGEAEEIGLVIEPWRVTGCYKTNNHQ